MSNYVVTGGAGFIGSALVRALVGRGEGSVRVIDNLLTGHERNLEGVRRNITFDRVDIRDFGAVRASLGEGDVVFHLAAIPSVPRSIREPTPSHEVNIDGTFNILRACVEAKARRVIYAASSSAYGDTEVLPKVETMLPRPKSPYAAQKLMGEYYASVFHSCFGLETVSLRFFNVYGERQDPSSPYSGVLSLFMRALMERRAPTIFGDGEQTRDFTYVEDVAALCLKAAVAPGAGGKTYNAGNGGRYSLNHIWDLLQKIEGVSLKARYAETREGDVRDSQADTTAARRDLGHDPQFTLEQGLRRTLAWYKAQ
ncbi:MAG TPA: SDR family oxidoreductase [Bryobacteraceae bacterium]|nr:SDR family oxidoreductase [Bryobacteraceae bacterium]